MVDGELRVGLEPLLRVDRFDYLTVCLMWTPLVLDDLYPADFWGFWQRLD